VRGASQLAAAELLARVRGLAGCTLGEVADRLGVQLTAAKGSVGRLMERALGGVEAVGYTDFAACELKTVPVDASGRPRESTFVCHVQLAALAETSWETSRVRAKLARVLWVPIESAEGVEHARRRVGSAFLWEMSEREETVLRGDYVELAERAALGCVERVDARWGRALQLRPKAANAAVRVRVQTADGPVAVQPRAFYLRASFTKELVAAALSAG
jgi:DNA mismatch repair protein MutH